MQTRGLDDAAELLRSLPDPVMGCDADGTVVYRRNDGRTLSVQSRWVARRDPEGRWVGSVAIDRVLDGEAAGPAPDPAPASTTVAPG